MSRKNRPKQSQASPATATATATAATTEPAARAAAALAASRFKEAVEAYKALLKTERRPQWLEALAAAYAGRAGQLADKGMLKEALALWRTRAEACGVPLVSGPYVGWLLQGGQLEAVLALLRADGALSPQERLQVQTALAAHVLLAPAAVLTRIPEDSPLLRHRGAALAAVQAAARGDDAALAEASSAIPFRSPYRDLRSLLKAMALLRSDPGQAAEVLARVADGGPFERLARALRVAVLPADAWLAGLRGLDDAGRALVLALAGCPESQRALVLELAQAGDPPPPLLYELAMRHRHAWPADVGRDLALRLLPHVPQRIDAFASVFGPLGRADRERALALAAESRQRYDRALRHWLQYVAEVQDEPGQARRAAAVLRHLADDRRFPDDDMEGAALNRLARSLDLDPGHRDAELQLLRGLREQRDLKQARARLDAALTRFPGDAEVLLEAVETALAGGAFKKAIALAKQLLAIDPINPRVRSVIGQAHLSQARKQIAAHKQMAARRELDEADSWLRGSAERATLALLRGLAAETPAEGDSLLRHALQQSGGPMLGAFRLAVEAERTRAGGAAALLKRAGADLQATPDSAQLVALAQTLNAARADDSAVRVALTATRAMLLRAANQPPASESELALVCEALHRHAQPALTQRFAAAALQRWPGQPTFVYFDAAARYGSQPWRMPERELDRLDEAFERAREQGDLRLASRLSDLLHEADGDPLGFGDEDEDDDEAFAVPDGDMDEMVEAMLETGGADAFLEMARRDLGKSVFDELRRAIGGGKEQFARVLAEMLKSAAPKRAAKPAAVPPPASTGRRGRRRRPPADDAQRGLFDD